MTNDTQADDTERNRCLFCQGFGHPAGMPDRDCNVCGGTGYRSVDTDPEQEAESDV